MDESVRFDRAADFYDRTRATSAESMARTLELLSGELRGRGPVLEVGVGTGMLALPLYDAGIPVVGVDLSAPMLRKLVEKAGGRAPFSVVQADATRMPYVDGAFGAGYLRWVLHLIPEWRSAIAEVVRVVRPSGVFLANLGSYGGARRQIQERFERITQVSTDAVGLAWTGFSRLDEEMAGHGARLRELPPIHEGGEQALEEFLEGIERDRYSWTWPVPERLRMRAAAELRPWAKERFGPLDEPRAWEHDTVWRAYDLR